MLTTERHQLIIDEINQRETVTLQELINLTHSSTSTIRRDLSQLEQRGLLKRVHGGATQIAKRHEERNMTDKELRFQDEKQEIARLAASLIADGDTIYLDAGTTTLEMIPFITQQDIIVVTNGLTHVRPLLEKGIPVYMTGGEVKSTTFANIGVNAVKSLERYRFDKAFIGMNGIDLHYGLSTPDPNESEMKEKAIHLASQVYVLLDHSKFNEVSFAVVTYEKSIELLTSEKAIQTISNFDQFKEKYNINGGL
ncbi:DeoR/GlpR family DNA-binding transcription regulator [Mammaliicoccus fleurettii]|uniref:DeoR/GlpR family DNA-binding transcription regulator n=1 Tax=Mammaliicoccus fleurettii TaxID=150056 RepID=UPI000E07893E|nr:DeoR/GlpR family DNA-binding transcription regulator [Mammaliicoccus fleurettii]RTX90286.1 DeoR/GlpR transcriptional regulator [Mammaliicoccus fleurettii]SUM37412.1 transcription repressor of fructose operon [Mammaliicoccus fleurettii]HCN61381.1 DeoR family transcriptional regulator [Staphylococcus sp.]